MKTIVFDFFGVFVSDPQKAWQQVHDIDGTAISAIAKQLDTGQITYEQYIEQFAALSGQTANKVGEEIASAAVLNESLVTLVEQLKHNYQIGLISNAGTLELQNLLAKYNLERLFDVVVISADVGVAKPDPAIFEHALAMLGCSADNAVFIDDTAVNVQAAKQFGMQGVVFSDTVSLQTSLRAMNIIEG